MNVAKKISLLMMLLSIVACAPVVYERASQNQYERNDVVHRHDTYAHEATHYYEAASAHYQPVQITLYADRSHAGLDFKPIRFVVAANEYVRIPLVDKRGRYADVFVHYLDGDLHLDSDRTCRNIYGSSHFYHDKRWDKGRKYSQIKVGQDYDLRGLQVEIRNVSQNYYQKYSQQHYRGLDKLRLLQKQLHSNIGKQVNKQSKRERTTSVVRNQHDNKKVIILKKNQRIANRYDYKEKTYADRIKIKFKGGSFTIDGKKENFKKTSLTLKDGELRKIALVAKNGAKVFLPVSYRNGTLKVKRAGRFKSEPSWLKGKTYKINTEGDTHLNNVKLTVIAL